ncbi:hypothetical protein [Candidatus Phytoplasma ziziphi]|uniref:hypothetical protein n=1 Tax=Ziziphus jujuba witches'-broom phytoplasma TaxID=135727 RepID=UPI001EDFC1E9|nr:hypothetical protein [Candidatus Phytoplasma ziziphi]
MNIKKNVIIIIKIKEIKDKFPSLESTNFDLQQKIDDKQKKINVKQEDQKQFKYLPNQPESIRTTRKTTMIVCKPKFLNYKTNEMK